MLSSTKTPGTKTVPFIAEMPLLGSLRVFMNDRMGFLDRLPLAGDVSGFHLGPIPILFFNKPEHVQTILIERADAFSKGKLMRKALNNSNGLFISEGDFHRKQRKLMAPMFQPRHIVNYVETIVQYGELIARSWDDQAVIDLNQQMINLTLCVIGKVLFDIDMLKESDEIGAAMATGFEHTVRKMSSPFMLPDSWPTPYNRHVRAATVLLEGRILQMIEERRQQRAQHQSERLDMLSVLLDARDEDGSRMSDRQVLDECIVLLGAGHETTAAALAWTWYFLCQNPALYTQVKQEVQQTLQGRQATFEDLARLRLCLQVFKEAMRLYPPAAGIFREALEEMTIDGYRIPKGASVLISPYTLHRRAENFPQPEVFDPTRFSSEREKLLPRYAYIPFGAGPRICIGNHFALMEGQLLIATLVQQASLSLVPGQHIEPDPVHNLAMRPGGRVEAIVQRNCMLFPESR